MKARRKKGSAPRRHKKEKRNICYYGRSKQQYFAKGWKIAISIRFLFVNVVAAVAVILSAIVRTNSIKNLWRIIKKKIWRMKEIDWIESFRHIFYLHFFFFSWDNINDEIDKGYWVIDIKTCNLFHFFPSTFFFLQEMELNTEWK